MDPFITAAVLTIEQLFSGSYRFRLPWVQRAYAWNEMHVGRLIDDVHAASLGERQRYSLGHVCLAKPGPDPDASLIDGHQRAVTLTILFALLRDMLPPGPLAQQLHALIEGTSGYHLTPQASIAEFFASFVQQAQRARAEPDGDIMDLTESERNLLANRNHMHSKIEKLLPNPEARAAFAGFLLQRCWVLVKIVDDEEEAWSLLSIEEETGLELHSSERSKLSLVMEMPRAEQEDASRIYEQAQAIVGADDMSKLLGHIRTLKVRKRSNKAVEHDLMTRFKLDKSGMPFLEHELLPRAQAMMRLKRRLIGTGPEAAANAIARSLDTLYWLDHQFWMPAALHWLGARKAEHPETPLFLARLDRLAWLLKIGSVDPTDQERRLMAVLDDIDQQLPVDGMPQLLIEPDLLADALSNLRSPTFYSKRHHGLVLRRIGWNLAPERDPGPVDGRYVTVEHVLPRKPPKDRRWWQAFKSAADITAYCNRIGNLVFLSNEDNRRADTSDYVVKREFLQKSAPRFALTEHAAAEETWTRATIMARSDALIGILLAPWELSA